MRASPLRKKTHHHEIAADCVSNQQHEHRHRLALKRHRRKLQTQKEKCQRHFEYVQVVRARAEEIEENKRVSAAKKHLQKRFRNKRVQSEEIAARTIQKYFKVLHIRKQLRIFQDSKIGSMFSDSAHFLAQSTFDSLAAAMQAKSSLVAAAKIIRLLGGRQNQPIQCPNRVFLTVFMIVAHPEFVFDKIETFEAQLQKSADDVLEHLHLLSRQLEKVNPTSILNALHRLMAAWISYSAAFTIWSKQDYQEICTALSKHHQELCRLRITVMNDTGSDQVKCISLSHS